MSKRTLATMNHEKSRLVERVDYITSPGFLKGGSSRQDAGLKGGPAAVITDRAILRPDGGNNELHLASVHPGQTAEDVCQHPGWDLQILQNMCETPAPTAIELDALHTIDKEGFWR